jgi:hypothetical protein
MRCLKRFLAIVVLIAWAAFLYLDWQYQSPFSVVPSHVWPQSELYCPLQFFAPLTKWVAFLLTTVLSDSQFRDWQ